MASPTAHAPHSGPVDQPGEGAYLWARSGIARSGTTRSNYVSVQTSIDWIVRDTAGNIISTTDISGLILHDSLRVTQALNDEPDTCSFTLKPQAAPAPIPAVGQEIRIAWAPGGSPDFHGYIVTAQSDWRLTNMQPPWIAIQCQDPMWRFDARIVTYRFPAQSVSDSIAFLVKWFCNVSAFTPSALDFATTFVQPGMPSLPAFDVVNQRPSTVMRTLTANVNGGFYIEGFTVHAWANSVSEPNQTHPTPLTVGLKTLHSFRRSEDATQVRRAVLVEGRRTQTFMSLPAHDPASPASPAIGIPLGDASQFDATADVAANQLGRLGPQWVHFRHPVPVTANGTNPPQSKVQVAFVPGDPNLYVDLVTPTPHYQGWIRIGNQYAAYQQSANEASRLKLILAATSGVPHPYGQLTVPVAVGAVVEWVDCVMVHVPRSLNWRDATLESPIASAQYTDAPAVVLAVATTTLDQWPPLEGFVQDGRYSYAGAQARAADDLAAFKDPLVSLEWETDDLNALPGRSQVIALSSDAVNPAINTTVTILRVELSFPLRTRPPRRRCTGGLVKPSTFMDLVLTESN